LSGRHWVTRYIRTLLCGVSNRGAQPGLYISGRCHGLIQPLHTQLGAFRHDGNRFLFGCDRGGVPIRSA
jgi:hypothetical protein